MQLTLTLPADLGQSLQVEAGKEGMTVEDYALKLLNDRLELEHRRSAAVQLLQSWMDDDDEAEQIETGDYLIRVLDEDRPSQRKLFPQELKGKSW